MADCNLCGDYVQGRQAYCNKCFKECRYDSLPRSYLQGGYFDEKGKLREDLITHNAKKIAHSLAIQHMKATALRKFYTKVKVIQRKLESSGDFSLVVPDILELVPFVHNAVTRDVARPLFRDFIERNVEHAAKTEEAFVKGFIKHFQYIVAFFPRK